MFKLLNYFGKNKNKILKLVLQEYGKHGKDLSVDPKQK